jgi:REP element-mobilizing transposase RayT
VTVCTLRRRLLFQAPAYAAIVESSWRELEKHFPSVELDQFVVMPNHIHGIVFLHPDIPLVGAELPRSRVVGEQPGVSRNSLLAQSGGETPPPPGDESTQVNQEAGGAANEAPRSSVGAGFPRPAVTNDPVEISQPVRPPRLGGGTPPLLGNQPAQADGRATDAKNEAPPSSVGAGFPRPTAAYDPVEVNEPGRLSRSGGGTPPLLDGSGPATEDAGDSDSVRMASWAERAPTLGQVTGYFKYQAARRINSQRRTPGAAIWQRGYYEHIIRNQASLERIRQYIIDNPRRWELDPENPDGQPDGQELALRRSDGRPERRGASV